MEIIGYRFDENDCSVPVYDEVKCICIDKSIIEHIRILNNKGYRTLQCCEGHMVGNNLYISFSGNNYGFGSDVDLPKGFVLAGNNNVIQHIFISEKDFNEKEKYLSILLEWCNSLEDLNNKVR